MRLTMDDERKDDTIASTSKKDSKLKHDDIDKDRDQPDDRSYSETTGSAYSGRSRLDMRAEMRTNIKPVLIKRDGKPPERKKKVRRGRVTKRRRSQTKRHYPVRRTTKRKPRITHARKEPSVSTIFTRMSSRSGSGSLSCAYCGHRCCGRR